MKNWQKGRTRPNSDLTLQSAMDTKTDQFKQIAREAKQSKWKSFYEELNAEITLTQFWQFYQQLEGDARTKIIPDIKNTNKAKLKTNQEKGQANLGRFLQQSNQNKLEERKHIMSDLNRTLAQSGSDDDLTEEEFNEALRKSGKDTSSGTDGIRYSDIKNLTEEDRAELYTI